MSNIFLCLMLLVTWHFQMECIQPYFPPQITFTTEDAVGRYLFAVDEINQRAYQWHLIDSDDQLYSYAMQHFPYAIPDSPESKNYVQLNVYDPVYCVYTAIWKHGSGMHDSFPEHWYYNSSSFKIGNVMEFSSKMMHATNISIDEDYWYSEVNCSLQRTGEVYPCEEIFFKKNTDIPVRHTYFEGTGWYTLRVIVNYKIISMGKPSDKLFAKIPENWMNNCTDLNLGLDFILPSPIIKVNESATVKIRLTSPPHRLDGNDTVTLQWRVDETSSECQNCLRWEPKQFNFNIKNFDHYQTMIVSRVKDGSETTISPIMKGGGYDKTRSDVYRLLFR
ncbi:unnamed protein product [Rotaria magnacalcarata]|uniref:Uncharacterized protein n=2 Tax=Rotaria magnacalcarata TaxID=392030 RepID=A0A816QF76_9BILA|nr:unnamed protein product [Rotaria magnacalcarata]